nr:chaperone protein dnaj gfa2, mitochondrial [Quercus suber]
MTNNPPPTRSTTNDDRIAALEVSDHSIWRQIEVQGEEFAKEFTDIKESVEALANAIAQMGRKIEGMDSQRNSTAHNSHHEEGSASPYVQQEDGGVPNDFHNPFKDFFRDNIFEDFFGRRLGGEDVKESLELSFMEAVRGSTKTVTFQTHLPCEPCGGRGVAPGVKPEKCTRCKGLGTKSMQQGPFMVQITCPQCHGEREIVPPKYIYKSCKGRQVVLETKSVKLNIVPGVDNDETIKVSRSGGADPDGNQPGDLYIVIKVREDPVFRREGNFGENNPSPNSHRRCSPQGSLWQPAQLEGSFEEERDQDEELLLIWNLTPRQRELIEEFAKEEQGEYDKRATA